MKDSEANGKLHAHLIQVMKNLQPITPEQRLRSHLWQVLNDPDDGDEYLRSRHHHYGDELVEESKAAIASARKRSYQSRRSPSPSAYSDVDDESSVKKKENLLTNPLLAHCEVFNVLFLLPFSFVLLYIFCN